jgi:hypothetical protein
MRRLISGWPGVPKGSVLELDHSRGPGWLDALEPAHGRGDVGADRCRGFAEQVAGPLH